MLAVWTGTTYQIGVPAWLDGAVKLPIIIAVRANSTAVSTALEPDEMLMEVELPVAQPRSGACFMEVSRRRGDFAIIGVACTVRVDEEARCSAARIGLCNAGDMPIFAAEASEIFTKPYTPKTNGKAERFIQTALREWAYARAYQNYKRTDPYDRSPPRRG